MNLDFLINVLKTYIQGQLILSSYLLMQYVTTRKNHHDLKFSTSSEVDGKRLKMGVVVVALPVDFCGGLVRRKWVILKN